LEFARLLVVALPNQFNSATHFSGTAHASARIAPRTPIASDGYTVAAERLTPETVMELPDDSPMPKTFPRTVFDADNIGMLGERGNVRGRQRHTRVLRNGIQHHWNWRFVRHSPEMRD